MRSGGFQGSRPPGNQQSPALTKVRAPAVVQAAVAERDAIQANLLELDGSFGKRLLEGATLSGETKRRWEAAAASLATLWQIYSAYSAVIDRAAEAVKGRLGPGELAGITGLLTGPSIQLAAGPAPPGASSSPSPSCAAARRSAWWRPSSPSAPSPCSAAPAWRSSPATQVAERGASPKSIQAPENNNQSNCPTRTWQASM